MHRVMLVDDEPLALEGLALLIDWKREGFEICARCHCGKEALSKIQEAQPHLIVTDIKMQDISGLELISAARKSGYEGAFIIVSGYGDFEYARKAMNLGVAGYLLKPLDAKEAGEVLEHIRKDLIDKEIRNKLPIADYQQNVTALFMGQTERASMLPIGKWQIITWGIPLAYDVVNHLLEGLSQGGMRATTHIAGGREWLVLYDRDGIDNASILMLKQALFEIERDFILGEQVTHADEMYKQFCSLNTTLDDFEDELIKRCHDMARAVSLLQQDVFSQLADEMTIYCNLRGISSKAKAYELFFSLCSQQMEAKPDKHSSLLNLKDIKSLGLTAIRLLTPVPQKISDQVKAYVHRHHIKRLTLEQVADALGYNVAYLGRIFREETGIGFRDYLSDLRVTKAAEMMVSTTLPAHKIASEVGYSQYKLFLEHFKRQFGKTPVEFRQSISP